MPEQSKADHPKADENAPLVMDHIVKRFAVGQRTLSALDRVSLRMEPGSVTGLIGPDGAGKTTLLRLVAGLLRPDEGRIAVLGIDAVDRPLEVQAMIGYMPQRFGLYQDLTVQENLDLYADLQGVPIAQRRSRYEELMQMTGLGSFADRYAGDLSGGMKQKLGLACTLVRPPQLLLLDEPTAGVDPVSRRELWEIVYRMVEEEGLSVLLSTAYLDEAERCRQVVLMHQGQTLGSGSPADFSREADGQVFHITTPADKKRRLQLRLFGSPGVVDAVVQGQGVRMVVEKEAAADAAGMLPEDYRDAIEKVDPRFEDVFIVRLRAEDEESSRQSTDLSIAPEATHHDDEVIRVDNLKRRYGDFYAVKGISFVVREGDVFGLLGANGAGKSTTFRMLCGLLSASAGSLRVAGEDLRRAAAAARGRIGYMAQHFSLYGDLSVAENLRFFSSAYGLKGKHRRERIQWALDTFELSAHADRRSGNLPLGFKQRLALSAALMHEPAILFLDEPTSGVDPLARREFWQRIGALSEQGVTVMITTHFMEEAEYCDRLVIMDQGEILAEGTPEMLKDPFRSKDNPEPTMEETFIGLIENKAQPDG
jgi:ABC-2 type transport system ATP-binding protein